MKPESLSQHAQPRKARRERSIYINYSMFERTAICYMPWVFHSTCVRMAIANRSTGSVQPPVPSTR